MKRRRRALDLAVALDVDLVGPVDHDLGHFGVLEVALDGPVAEDVVGDVLAQAGLVGQRQRRGLVGQRRLEVGVDPWPQVLGREPALGQLGTELLDEALVHPDVDFLEEPGPRFLGGEEGAGLAQVVGKGHGIPLTRIVGTAPGPAQHASAVSARSSMLLANFERGALVTTGTPRLTDSATRMSLGRAASTLSCSGPLGVGLGEPDPGVGPVEHELDPRERDAEHPHGLEPDAGALEAHHVEPGHDQDVVGRLRGRPA